MAIINYAEYMPESNLLDQAYRGYQMGSQIQQDVMTRRTQEAQFQQAQERQSNVKSLSDLYASPEFQKLQPKEQMATALPLVAKVDPKAAFDITQQAQQDEKDEMKSVLSVFNTLINNKDQEGANTLLSTIQKYYPALAGMQNIALKGPEAEITSLVNLQEGNPMGVAPGQYKATFGYDPRTGKMGLKKAEPVDTGKPGNWQEVTANGRPTLARYTEGKGWTDANGQVLSGVGAKMPTSVQKTVIYGMGDSGGVGGKSNAQFDRLMARLPETISNDSELKILRGQLDAASNLAALSTLDKNAIAQMGMVFSTAKVFDSGGRLSNQDVEAFMRGNPSLKAGAERAWARYVKGQNLLPEDIAALKATASAVSKATELRYNRKLQQRENRYIRAVKKFGPEYEGYVKDQFSTEYIGDTPFSAQPMASPKPTAQTAPKPAAQTAPAKQKFIEGQIYRDGKGGRARYVNGKFVEVR